MATDENEPTMTPDASVAGAVPADSTQAAEPVAAESSAADGGASSAAMPSPMASAEPPAGPPQVPALGEPDDSAEAEEDLFESFTDAPAEADAVAAFEAAAAGSEDFEAEQPALADGDADGEDGDGIDAADSGAEGLSDSDDGAESALEGAVDGTEAGPRKRRRRRRKRRSDAAAEGASGAPSDAASDDASQAAESFGAESARDRRERPAFSPGDQVFGKVAQRTEQSIFVDIAGKATGLFDLAAWTGDPPKIGDQFIAKVQSCSMRGGMVMLVAEPTAPADARARLRQASESGEPIEGWVTGVIKGGAEVDFDGIRAFAPASHVDLRAGADLSHLLGQRLPFVVTQYAKKGRDIVVSRKATLEKEAEQHRGELLASITPETICDGVVRRVLNWGIFVTLPAHGDVEGVIHMSEASHDRGARLTERFKVGQTIAVKVLRVDDKGKLWLSRRAVEKNPWDDVAQKYPLGSRHSGLVVRLAEFGAFIQLEPGVDGLCHVSDLSFQPIDHPSEAVQIGDALQVVVANLDPHAHKIGLHPAPPDDEQSEARPRLQAHQTVNVVVMQVKEGGLGVRIVGLTGRAQRGFIPSGQTGTPRGTELRKVFPVGKRLEAKVVEVDPRKGESKLSIRALKDDAEREAYRQYRKQLAKEATFGTLGDLLKKS